MSAVVAPSSVNESPTVSESEGAPVSVMTGAVSSNTTSGTEVIASTVVVADASSLPTTAENVTMPSASTASIVAEAVHEFPPAESTTASCPAIVTDGVMRGGMSTVNDSVTTSPGIASEEDALLDAIETGSTAGPSGGGGGGGGSSSACTRFGTAKETNRSTIATPGRPTLRTHVNICGYMMQYLWRAARPRTRATGLEWGGGRRA